MRKRGTGEKRNIMADRYPFAEIEPKWQKYWLENKTFKAVDNLKDKPKYYILDMFPYPSGQGLHVGHPEGYTATDIIARYKRMRGFNVLHPMGWDAFGLPAEQYAIETGTPPDETTARNITTFKRQIQSLGVAYKEGDARRTLVRIGLTVQVVIPHHIPVIGSENNSCFI